MKEEVICDYLTLKRLTGNYSAIVDIEYQKLADLLL